MFKRIISYFTFTLVIGFTSCQNAPYTLKEPVDLIPKDTMVMVMKDLSLMEAHLQTKYVQLSNYYKSLKLSGDLVLNKYHLSSNRLERSLVYYGSQQKEMQEMYASILDTLTIQSNIAAKQNIGSMPRPSQISPIK